MGLETIRKYGRSPYRVGLLHGGPGAAGEMKPVARELSTEFGVLEFLQTGKSVSGQIEELYNQVFSTADIPLVLVGYSWGAWLGYLFAARFPALVEKLILVGAPSFDSQYNSNLMQVRLDRLKGDDKVEAEKLLSRIHEGILDNDMLRKFGELMTIADAYDYSPSDTSVNVDWDIFQKVWKEASRMRERKDLLYYAKHIVCPVVAIHGVYDPHPVEGVEKSLSEHLSDFRLINLPKCGHTPWVERQAKDLFFEVLRKEISGKG